MLNYGTPSAATILRATLSSVLSSNFNRSLSAAKGSTGWRRKEYLNEAHDSLGQLVDINPAKAVEKTLELAAELTFDEHVEAIQYEVGRLIRTRR